MIYNRFAVIILKDFLTVCLNLCIRPTLFFCDLGCYAVASIHCCLSSSRPQLLLYPRLMLGLNMRLSTTPSWVANCSLKLRARLGAVAYLTGAIRPCSLADVACIFVIHLFNSRPVCITRIKEKCAYVETQTSLYVNKNKIS